MVREELVSPGYRATLGSVLLRGRDLDGGDTADGLSVAVVNERMAELYWPGEDAVGQQFHIALPPTDVTVVGVVETGKYTSVAEDPAPAYFRPIEQTYIPTGTFFVRTEAGSVAAAEEARRTLQALDPALPVFNVMPAQGLVTQATWNTRAVTVMLAAFGLLGLVLAAVGVFVSLRRRSGSAHGRSACAWRWALRPRK